MKTSCTFLILLFLLVSGCQKTKPSDSELLIKINTPGQQLSAQVNNLELKKVCGLLKGIWLPSTYVQELEKTKSPYLASKLIPDIAELQIDPNNLKGDSLIIGSSLGNHEGYSFKIWVKEENGQPVFQSDVREWDKDKYISEFKYRTQPDTIISLVTRDKAGKILQTIDFIRVRGIKHITQSGGLGYNYIARKTVLNGAYSIIDSINQNIGSIKLDAESGEITGFKFKYYQLQTDFAIGPESKTDLLILFPAFENYRDSDSFELKVINDTVQLWSTLKDTNDNRNLGKKDLKYTFIKENNYAQRAATKKRFNAF